MKKYIITLFTCFLLSSCVWEKSPIIDDECNIIGKKTETIDCSMNKNCVNEYAKLDRSECYEDDSGMKICPQPKQIGCRKLSDYEIKKEEGLKNICEKTGGVWGTSPSQPGPSKHCICEKTSERITYSDDEYKKYQLYSIQGVIENFNERDGCISIKKSCELMGGTWEYNTGYKFYDICRVNEQMYQYFNGQWNKGIF